MDFNTTSTGQRNGKAWIQYATNKQAVRAMDALDGSLLKGRSIEIKRYIKKIIEEPTSYLSGKNTTASSRY